MLCAHGDRITMKKACLITGFFDCCRLDESGASERVAVSEVSRGLLQKLILYACERHAEAYDGKGKHGSDCICRNKALRV